MLADISLLHIAGAVISVYVAAGGWQVKPAQNVFDVI